MIGVFDSGLGGLGALGALRALLPQEDVIYLADTAHLPYGNKDPRELRRYTEAAVAFLAARGVSHLLVACGTVSATVLDTVSQESPIPLYGVIGEAAAYAASHSPSGRIGIIGTATTVQTGAFAKALLRHRADAKLFSLACPLFVSLAEYGFTAEGDPVALAAARHYLSHLTHAGIDTLILGCTHFSMLSSAIAAVLPSTLLVDSGVHAAHALCKALPAQRKKEEGRIHLYTTADPDGFLRRAAPSLDAHTVQGVQRVRL